jgi:hypothetical protein
LIINLKFVLILTIKTLKMKKLSLLTVLILIAFAGFFSGCDNLTQDEAPLLDFFGGAYIDANATVQPGGVLKFSWLATKGSSNLVSFTIERDGITLAGYPDETIPNDNYKDSVSLEAPSNEGVYIYEFIVTDKNDLTASESFTITVEQTGSPIKSWTSTLGAHQAAAGSSFASITGVVYQMNDAKTNSTLIDFLYYYGANNLATLAAPDDADAATVFNNVNNGLSTWSTRNSTRFNITSLTAANFDAITDDLLLISHATGAADTDENQLAVGNVIAFVTDADKTGGSKMGLIKITSITTGATGSMGISVKVQE